MVASTANTLIKQIPLSTTANLHSRVALPANGTAPRGWVIMLHGFLGAARNLWRLAEGLTSANLGVILYDQRGHGHSSWIESGSEYSLDVFAADLETVLAFYTNEFRGQGWDLNQVHLCGHSMGGRVCLRATARIPANILSLALMDVGPWLNQAAFDDLCSLIDPLPLEFNSKAEAAEFLAPEGFALQQFLLSNMKVQSDGKVRWVCDFEKLRKLLHAGGVGTEQSDDLRKAQCPTLLLRGGDSGHFTKEEALRAQNLNQKNIRLNEVPRAGHWLHSDNFEGTLNGLLQWYGDK